MIKENSIKYLYAKSDQILNRVRRHLKLVMRYDWLSRFFGVEVVFDLTLTSCAGIAHHKGGTGNRNAHATIKMSWPYFRLPQNLHEFEPTLLHELAHILVGPGHSHDITWQMCCRAIGGVSAVCHTMKSEKERPQETRETAAEKLRRKLADL